ncbi:hypothetical protein ACFFHJ_10055 [Planotetraspora thailandica]|uniref:hypothetical protein n=1 Tax=Planotetraspora thailandica TaxID=487172 RepID=UPI001951145F|nr:hypothetical protein [Planotetraspora thailandica]
MTIPERATTMSPYGWRNPFVRLTPPPPRETPPEDDADPAPREPATCVQRGRVPVRP